MIEAGKTLNKSLFYDGYNLTFELQKYWDGTTAVLANSNDGYGERYATMSLNLSEYGYYPYENQIYFNHDLSRDLKEAFCEEFCEEPTLSCCEEIKFGPYDTKTQKVTIRPEFLK